jgi:Mg2+/Co2+ transporter CorB
VVKETDNSFLVKGTANVRDLNRVMHWKLPTDGAKTLNGLVLESLQTIPESGTELTIDGYAIEIIETRENRVQLARLYVRGGLRNAALDKISAVT